MQKAFDFVGGRFVLLVSFISFVSLVFANVNTLALRLSTMTLVDSLPARPLDDGEVTALNRSDAVDLAIAVDDDEPTDAVLLATDSWVKALLLTDDGWSVVETVSLAETERYEALRICEETARAERAEE